MIRYAMTDNLPDPPLDPPENCEDDGHDWKTTFRDGDTFSRCRRCGKEVSDI